jgi:ArsR family transcriptional regulator
MIQPEIISKEHKKAARYAKAMGHPIRMYVLELLSKQSCCYSGDLTEILPIVKSTLSQHLKELKYAGLNQENWKEAQILLGNILNYPIKQSSCEDDK